MTRRLAGGPLINNHGKSITDELPGKDLVSTGSILVRKPDGILQSRLQRRDCLGCQLTKLVQFVR